MVINWLFGRSATARGKSTRSQSIHFRPTLEYLETRLTPSGPPGMSPMGGGSGGSGGSGSGAGATFTWIGGDFGSPTSWTDTKNWSISGNTNHAYPGAGSTNNDTVIFNNSATTNATLNQNIALDSLTLASNFGKALQVSNGSTISLTTGDATATFSMQGGTLTFKNASSLALSGLGTNASWTGGDLSSTGDAGASVYIYGSTTLLINSNASTLGASLVIGQSASGADSAGTVNVADPGFMSGLAGNVTLYQNANLNVMPNGVLNFNQSANSSTRGGIAVAQGQTCAINNQGTINRVGNDATFALKINAQVINSANTSLFYTGPNTLTDCSAQGFWLNKGELRRAKGSSFWGLKGAVGTGVIRIVDNSGPGNFNVYFGDSVDLESGYLVFAEASNETCTLVIGGNLTLGSSEDICMNANGSNPGSCDEIQVAGITTINSAILTVNTLNTSPSSGSIYTFLAAAGGFATNSAWSTVTNTGYSASWSLVSPGQIEAN